MRPGATLPVWWERCWFRPGSARNLAAARIVLALQALWVLLSRDFAAVSGALPEYWAGVSTGGQWRFLAFPGHAGIEQILQWLAVAALIAAVLGVLPRAACILAGLLLYHLAPLESLLWTHSAYSRGLTVSVLGLFVLGLGPCGDALSLRPSRRRREPWEYHWPLVLVQLLLAMTYLFAGYAKLVVVGADWLAGQTVREWLYLLSVDDEIAVFASPGLWLAGRPALCLVIGLGTIAFELSFIAVVFSKRARLVLVPLAVLFHAGVLFAMNIVWLNTPQLLVFVDWDRLVGRLTLQSRPRTAAPTPPAPPAAIPRSCT